MAAFWEHARRAVPALPQHPDDVWAFGATPAQADSLLTLVLAGTKTATASTVREYHGEDIPRTGEVSVILDGRGEPAAVIETVGVEVHPFTMVSAAHAYAEGEGDRSLREWRTVHERYWRAHARFDPEMEIVCERFTLHYPRPERP